MEFTRGQKEALSKLDKWWKYLPKQIFTINGYAGVGKTTVVKYFLQSIGLDPRKYRIMTLSGKASLVLSRQGTYARTLHSQMYNVANWEERRADGSSIIVPKFTFNPDAMEDVELMIIDEISMVPLDILLDALSYGIPILVMGDSMQLPAIGKDNGLLADPDVWMTEITRQAQDNPIIHISMLARKRRPIPTGTYRDSSGNPRVAVIPAYRGINTMSDHMVVASDQIICGYNKTRIAINKRARELKGFKSDLPVAGDKLICIKNNRNILVDGIPLINGAIGLAKSDPYDINEEERTFKLQFLPEYNVNGIPTEIVMDLQNFLHYDKLLDKRKNINQFDFGDAITGHKAQGSEYPKVVLYEEFLSYDEHHRWLYSCVTRAGQGLILFKNVG